MSLNILVTGGAGFIGSALCRHIIDATQHRVFNVDKLTYAGNLASLNSISSNSRYSFFHGDINDRLFIKKILNDSSIDCIIHLAAETHVDRSIDDPGKFVHANVVGTCELLESARTYWSELAPDRKRIFRFHHVSTDEVYGSLGFEGAGFDEQANYRPSSPYAASKASADHLVRAWHRTFGLPVVISNCSNNFGPHQFPEKLIPLMIINALEEKPLPVYGDGKNVRDWLFVEDHARALLMVATLGEIGQSYNIGGESERSNLTVVQTICDLIDRVTPPKSIGRRRQLIRFVDDRPGHDLRYALDCTKLTRALDWRPTETFESGLERTVRWYLANADWWRPLRQSRYQGQRLGTV